MNDNNKQSRLLKSPSGDLGVVGLANMEIKVLGPGCPKCKTLEKATLEAVAETGVKATVTKIDDIVEIMNFGVMTTPALLINNKVVVKGRVPSKDEIIKLITS
jgi:small redox-active disulfide protein 2